MGFLGADQGAVVTRQQPEARLHPGFQYGPLAAVGVEQPAAQQPEVIQTTTVNSCVFRQALRRWVVEQEMRIHIGQEALDACLGAVECACVFEQTPVQWGDAIELQRLWRKLESEAGQGFGGQIAAVE